MPHFLAALALLLIGVSAPQPGRAADPEGVIKFPSSISQSCRFGRAQLYDECSDQPALFAQALAEANRQGKVLLVSFGAEWCIWCHVFDAYVDGQSGAFTHRFSDDSESDWMEETIHERGPADSAAQAAALKRFVAENFVLVHIDVQHAPGGFAVLDQSGALADYGGWLPFIFAVDADGRYAGQVDHDRVEMRRDTHDWFRGYDRRELQAVLNELQGRARQQ